MKINHNGIQKASTCLFFAFHVICCRLLQASQACECLGSTMYQQLLNAGAGKPRQYV
jgi:hypothetical protein